MQIRPSRIRLDTSTICQLKCPLCGTAKGTTAERYGSGTLKFESFKSFVDANPWVRAIEISSQGEIFLNDDLPKIMQYAYEKKITLTAGTGTNLNTISEEALEALVKYQFSFLACSIDGASSETYKIYRRDGDFDTVIANIKKINALKAKYKSKLPVLRWQFILFGHNEHEILKAKLMARKLGMEFRLKLAWGNFSPVKNKDLIKKQTGSPITRRDEYQEEYGKVYMAESMCSQMWFSPQINVDGRVFGCYMNQWSDYGNAFEKDLTEILNSEKMNYARSMLLGKVKERKDIPCTKCACYKKMKKTNSWFYSKKKMAYA